MEHNLIYQKGTHPRNHVVRCSCGWASADTHNLVRKRGEYHKNQSNPLAWNDPGRKFQDDKLYPPFRSLYTPK